MEHINPVTHLDTIISDALARRSSDIHIDPGAAWLFVYFRIDGMITLYEKYSLDLHEGLIARIKVLARLPLDERRLPKDGRFRWEHSETKQVVEVRVSMMPTVFGENAVLRLFDPALAFLTLEELGFPMEHALSIEDALAFSSGLIIITGPTGSGKTTAMYAMLARLNDGTRNIITIEDPIERKIPGIRQIEVGVNTLVDFPSVLRSVLRQDPDVLMIGEIRDKESAELALQCALTGHLVITTLHASSLKDVKSRLVQMGVDAYLIDATLRLSVSTRLVQKKCTKCPSLLEENSGAECSVCRGTRVAGRTLESACVVHVNNKNAF